jgi:hypothetical protein
VHLMSIGRDLVWVGVGRNVLHGHNSLFLVGPFYFFCMVLYICFFLSAKPYYLHMDHQFIFLSSSLMLNYFAG